MKTLTNYAELTQKLLRNFFPRVANHKSSMKVICKPVEKSQLQIILL